VEGTPALEVLVAVVPVVLVDAGVPKSVFRVLVVVVVDTQVAVAVHHNLVV
jgi:hypothetical protein